MKTIKDNSFSLYGKVIDLDTSTIVDYLINQTKMPIENNLYIAHDEKMYDLPIMRYIENKYFGQMEMQTGYCNGFNSKLNALEYHASIEIDIASNDSCLILGRQEDINDGKIFTKDLQIFKMNKGDAVILYPGTLHFSPCKLSDSGFKMAILLPKRTNLDLPYPSIDQKLFKINKWLYAHEESKQAKNGAYIGIIGENIEIKY